jgi:ankyrin repeat protein
MQDDLFNLLRNGADANTADANGFTLLMHFTRKNDTTSMGLLLSYAARINDKDALNMTALDYAIKDKHIDAVEFLINNGAHVSNDTYMYAIKIKDRDIIDFLDSLDPDKYIFLKNKRKR